MNTFEYTTAVASISFIFPFGRIQDRALGRRQPVHMPIFLNDLQRVTCMRIYVIQLLYYVHITVL